MSISSSHALSVYLQHPSPLLPLQPLLLALLLLVNHQLPKISIITTSSSISHTFSAYLQLPIISIITRSSSITHTFPDYLRHLIISSITTSPTISNIFSVYLQLPIISIITTSLRALLHFLSLSSSL